MQVCVEVEICKTNRHKNDFQVGVLDNKWMLKARKLKMPGVGHKKKKKKNISTGSIGSEQDFYCKKNVAKVRSKKESRHFQYSQHLKISALYTRHNLKLIKWLCMCVWVGLCIWVRVSYYLLVNY